MVTAAVEHFLVKFLQPYVDGIDANDLHLSLWKGKLELTDVKVKPDVLGLLGIEGVRVPKGLVKRICITLPSTRRILSGKISVNVEGVELHGLHLSEDSDQEALRNVRSTKLQAVELRMTQLRDLQKRQQQAKEAYDQAEPGFGVRFAKRLITNLSLQLMDVKLAFNSQDPRAAFAAEMSSLEVISTDSSFKKVRQDEVLEEQGSSLYKVLSFDGLSLSYGQTSQELSKVVSPLRAELKVAHVPDDGLLRLEVDLATDKPSRIDLKRSQVVGVLALKSALKNKWDRLRGMLVDPQEEARLMATLDESKERYFSLFRQQCLSSVDKGEAKIVAALEQRGLNFAPLEPKEMKELETLENVLPFQLLAAARHRAEDYLAELVKMATPQQAKQASGGWFSRTFWRREPEESPLDKLSTEEILKELNDGKAEVEVVETPQKVKVVLCGGQVLLDLEEDTRTGPALKLLNLDLKTTSLAVKVESATDHRGQSSADFRLDLGLGSANVSHQGKPFLRPKEVDMEIQQALVLRLENKVEPSQNLMELSLIFAPLEIYMIPGLVASLLGFWPGPPEVEKAAGVSLTQPTIVREEISAFAPGPSRAERLRDVLEENASRAKELAEEVYKRIPDKIGLEIRLSSPTVYVPVAVGQAIITLGQLSLKSPEPCLFDNLHFNIDLNHTFISTVNQNNESFDVVEPLPIHISLKYMEQKDFLSVNVEVKVGQLSLSASPEAVQLLMGLPEAMVSTLTVPVEVKQIQDPAPSPPLEKPGEEAERASLKTLDVTHVLGEDFAALQRAEELQKKRMRTTVSVSFDDATFALSDSIMPLLRLRMEAMPPGLHVEVESGCMDLKLDEASLGVEILNPRHGVWEPFLERFDFALSMKLAETTSLNLNALGPLLINVVPTPTHQMLELLPLLLASLRPPKRCDQSESLSSAVAKTKLRLVSLWGGQLDLLCSNGSGAKATSTTVGVYPTGSNYLTLDGQVSLLALRQFRVRAPGSSYTSDPLWFEQNAAVMVPGCQGDVVAQLLTPQPDHRLLFVAPPLRLHNCTDVALAIRFHDSTTKAVVQQMDSAVCDASLLGLRELRLPEGEPISERSTENELILPPNSLCAVPTGAMGPKTGSAASTIISVRPLSSTSFSVPTLVGAQAIEGISCAQMHFLVVQAIENIGQQAGLEKVKTLSIRPPLLLTNALPIGRLGLQFASATVTVPALQRLCFYGTSLAELRRGLNLCAQLAEGPWSGKEFLAGDDVVDTTGNVQGDEAKVLELRISSKGAAAALNLECLGHGELRLSCPHWLLDRSGLKETSYGRLEVHTRGAPLPSLEGVTLLPSDCFETPCDFVIRGPNGSVAAKYSMKMPPNFEAFVWRVPNGCLALNLQTGTVLNSSVFGATCMEFTLMPRLLLTNASDEDLQIETSQRSQLRLAPGESRVMHWEVPENTDGIDVLATTFRFRPSYANAFSGAVLCSDASAGSTPFSLTTAPGVVEVWSVDVSPLHGNLGVSIRKGSDFAAVNRTEDVRMQVQPISRFIHGCVIAISSGTGEKVIEVAPGERLPIGWATPFAGNRCREAKVTVGSEELSIDLQRTGTWPLKALGHRHGWIREETTGLALRVSRHGTTTELSLEDSAEKGAGSPRSGAQVSDEISASLALRVKLGRAGISLIDENPPRELFFFSLDMLRLEYLQDAVRDSEKVTLSVSEVQAICQLPDRTDGQDKVNMLDPSRLQHLPDALFKNQEFPAVVLANHSAGGKSFLQFQMMREATSSRDLLISSARLDVDKLDFTLDECWLTPLQTWLMHISGQGGFDLFGAPASELLAKAGKPITDGYVAPPVPAVVQAQGVKISALDTTVWCSLRLKYLEFLPAYIRAAVKVFSASNYFTLDGVSLALPARELEPHRGSLQDYTTAIRADYSRSVLSHLASLLGKSSFLNLPKAPLKLGGAAVALMSDGLTDVTEGAVSMLRNLTMDEEFIERKNRSKGQIQGAGQGFAAAGKSLMEGVEGIFDVVRKPVEGAQTGGIWGFGTGLAKGAMGTLVKPVAALGTAVGEVADGLASTSNQLNVNEGSERRRNRRRLRLPRLLYGELGEVRPFVDIDAQLFQRYGQFLQGVCEVIPLERQGSDASRVTTVLLLFSQNLAVAAAREAPRNELTTLERSFPALAAAPQESLLKEFTMSKVGGGLRGLSYADLQVFWIEGQVMHLKALNRDFKLDFTKAGLQEGAREALREGLQMAIDGRLQANRSWAELRAALRNDEHLARVRDMKMAAETGLKMIETDAARMSDRGAARIRRLEVFEVERFTLGFGWGTCNWPTDGELQWRWVQENGRKHPQVDERLTQKQATKAEEPPCQLGGLYKAAGPWSFEVIDKVTDKQGWVYGMAWSQPDWSQHQGLNLLRRRRWTRPFH